MGIEHQKRDFYSYYFFLPESSNAADIEDMGLTLKCWKVR